MTISFNSDRSCCVLSDLPDGSHTEILSLETGQTVDLEEEPEGAYHIEPDGTVYVRVTPPEIEVVENCDLEDLYRRLEAE